MSIAAILITLLATLFVGITVTVFLKCMNLMDAKIKHHKAQLQLEAQRAKQQDQEQLHLLGVMQGLQQEVQVELHRTGHLRAQVSSQQDPATYVEVIKFTTRKEPAGASSLKPDAAAITILEERISALPDPAPENLSGYVSERAVIATQVGEQMTSLEGGLNALSQTQDLLEQEVAALTSTGYGLKSS